MVHLEALGGLRRASALLLKSPLLGLSFVLFGFGGAWAIFSLVQSHPWLVPLSASVACFVLHWGLLLWREGLFHFFPSLELLLRRPVFELLCSEVAQTKLSGYKWIRLIVLAGVELDEAEHRCILAELSPDFRRRIFQRPAVLVVPAALRSLLLGERSRQYDGRDLLISDEAVADWSRETTTHTRVFYRSSSVGELLEVMRNEESTAQVGLTKFQKIINDKFGERVAVPFVKQNTMHEVEGFVEVMTSMAARNVFSCAARVPGSNLAERVVSTVLPTPWANLKGYLKSFCILEKDGRPLAEPASRGSSARSSPARRKGDPAEASERAGGREPAAASPASSCTDFPAEPVRCADCKGPHGAASDCRTEASETSERRADDTSPRS